MVPPIAPVRDAALECATLGWRTATVPPVTADTTRGSDEHQLQPVGLAAGRAIPQQPSSANDPEAAGLRDRLVESLRERGALTTGPVETAMRAVPRHMFVPDVGLDLAHADDIVRTKYDTDGVVISAASQPGIVAMMLDQLAVQPGHRILEIGAGTGYNAALLAHLAGRTGTVTTVDVDADIVEAARTHLAAAGYPDVLVVLGDGALGYPHAAPYDRVAATVGAWDVPLAWQQQVTPGGRLVVPLRLRGDVTRSVVFERNGDHWLAVDSQMCGFMPLRGGIADDPRHILALTPDRAVTLNLRQDQSLIDERGLAEALTWPPLLAWTGVSLQPPHEAPDWLWLWISCTMPNGLTRMPVDRTAVGDGRVWPQLPWGAMARAEGATLAYLTCRGYEQGVIAHGPAAADLQAKLVATIQAWDRDLRHLVPRIALQPIAAEHPIEGQFTFTTPRNRLAISWT